MLRHGRLGKWQIIDDFAANALASIGQQLKDLQPGRMRHGLELSGQPLVCNGI